MVTNVVRMKTSVKEFNALMSENEFVRAYHFQKKLKDKTTCTEQIFCNPVTGMIVYTSAVSGTLTRARLIFEAVIGLNFNKIQANEMRCYRDNGVCHMVCSVWHNLRKQIEMILQNAKVNPRWRVLPENITLDFSSDYELEFDIGLPADMSLRKISVSDQVLKKIVGIR